MKKLKKLLAGNAAEPHLRGCSGRTMCNPRPGRGLRVGRATRGGRTRTYLKGWIA